MLVSMLQAHPRVACADEVFNAFYHHGAFFDFLERGEAEAAPEGGVSGIKLLTPFLVPEWKYRRMQFRGERMGWADQIPPFEVYAEQTRAFVERVEASRPKVVHIARHVLWIYISEMLAIERRQFKYKDSFTADERLTFRIDHFQRWWREKHEVDQRTEHLRPPDRTLTIFYEDLNAPEYRQETMAEVFRHIGVEPMAVEPATRRQLPETLRDRVANADEMLDLIRAGPLAHIAHGLTADS